MNTIYLFRQRLKVELLSAGIIAPYKKQLVYQHGVDTSGNYVNLCGLNSCSSDVYVIMRSNTIGTSEPTEEERRVLLSFIKASIKNININKLTEILVRGLMDKELVSYFYDDLYIKHPKWVSRIQHLMTYPTDWEPITNLPPAQFDRHKYSIYQLMMDLKKYHAKICINDDILEYENLTTSHRDLRKDTSGILFAQICDVVGNKTKANLSLLVKSGDDYTTLCLVRDGKYHLTEFVILAENPYLRHKLYGAKLVHGSIISRDILHIQIERLPIISRKYLRVTEADLVSSLVNERVQEECMKMVPHPSTESTEKHEVVSMGSNNKFSYCELKTRLCSKKVVLSEQVEKELAISKDYKIRKRELKKARKRKNDMIFRYLLKKQMKLGVFSTDDKKYSASISLK